MFENDANAKLAENQSFGASLRASSERLLDKANHSAEIAIDPIATHEDLKELPNS